MQFQVNGKDYFLAFVEDEARWYIFAPTAQAIERIPVYVDAGGSERLNVIESGQRKVSS
jgi:hypothetical protein